MARRFCRKPVPTFRRDTLDFTKAVPQTAESLVQGRLLLAEGEADEIGRRRTGVKRADRNCGHAYFGGEAPAEFLVVAVVANGLEVSADEIGAGGGEDLEAQLVQAACQKIAL